MKKSGFVKKKARSAWEVGQTIRGLVFAACGGNRRGGEIVQSVLIKDTTRAQREEIVRRGLAACGDSCDGCSSCGNLGGGRVEEIYRPYIEGEKELSEINAEYRRGLVK